jgi:hypothetical protein
MINQNMFSQETERKVTIQASPLLWFIDIFSDDYNDEMLFAMDLEGQFKINNNINLSLTVSFLLNNHTVTKSYFLFEDFSYKEDVYQINFKPMLIYRPFETGIRGFYLGFYPNIGLVHVENYEENRFYTEVGFGMDLGYKWVFRGGFTMQLGGGIIKSFSIPKGAKEHILINSDGSIPMTYTDIRLLDFKLGYSF